MSSIRLALANLAPAASRDESVANTVEAIKMAGEAGAAIVAFPEAYVPGYRIGAQVQPTDADWLAEAWRAVDRAAEAARAAVILGTERHGDNGVHLTARVTHPGGSVAGFQDKVQLDPTEESTYAPGASRRLFDIGGVAFGVVICHEGWRYPETVRWAARAGARIVFHPHTEAVDPGAKPQVGFANPANTFHEKAMLCRAAENTIYFASISTAQHGSTTTSALVDPEGRLIAHQPHGQVGLLMADIDLSNATGLLAHRLRPECLVPLAT